jgi:hypothetical protein
MRDALKTLFSKQITLPDGSIYLYTVQPFELTNALDNSIAVLTEYSFSKKESSPSHKLYKTKDGYWYEIGGAYSSKEYTILRALKLAIDSQENSTVLE